MKSLVCLSLMRRRFYKLLLLYFFFFLIPSQAYNEESLVAEVGKEKITLKDYENRILLHEKSSSFQKKLQSLTPEGKKKILEEMIRDSLFYQDALNKGITLSEDTLKELELIKRRLLIKKYQEQIKKVSPVTEEELSEYYEKNKEEFMIPEKRKLTHIVVRTKAEAERLLSEIKNGKDFCDLAGEYNIDATKKKRGDLGWVKKGFMVKEFEEVAFRLDKGEISNVVKTKFGYHIIRVDDIKEEEQKRFEEVKPEIRKKIEELRLKEFEGHLREKYGVKVYEGYLRGGER